MNQIKYDSIGIDYNATRQSDPYITSRLLDLLEPQNDKLYLDLGCGTGNYTIALADKGFNFYGVEPSEKMLLEAQLRNPGIKWIQGKAEQIPVQDEIFDGAIATLTIHHWTDIKKSLLEINRVLSHNGKIVFFTSTPEQMERYWLNHYFPQMLYSSIVQMPSLEIINNAVTYANFEITTIEKYFIKDSLQDHFLYVGKNKPELYLNKKIRKGISSFSALANIEEVEKGLSKLKLDIETKTFDNIQKQYQNDLGDYLFIVANKKGSL